MSGAKNSVVELRQYTLKPGRRDELIALFEREFVESQEAEGMDLIGTFRDLDSPDRFVWLRGFPDMESRAKALAAFYYGPIWKAHRSAANDTMVDSDNVLLLKPAWSGSGFAPLGVRAPVGATGVPQSIVTATILYFAAPVSDALVKDLRAASEGNPVFVTEYSPNTFPALPVRQGEHVVVRFSDRPYPKTLTQNAIKREVLRLQPTARSKLR